MYLRRSCSVVFSNLSWFLMCRIIAWFFLLIIRRYRKVIPRMIIKNKTIRSNNPRIKIQKTISGFSDTNVIFGFWTNVSPEAKFVSSEVNVDYQRSIKLKVLKLKSCGLLLHKLFKLFGRKPVFFVKQTVKCSPGIKTYLKGDSINGEFFIHIWKQFASIG